MQTISDLKDIYSRAGAKSYSEQVSQLQHALQVAKLAEEANATDAQIAACLLHDIGHLIFDEGLAAEGKDDQHEIHGANIISQFFDLNVSEPVRLHVEAKRYLCSTDQNYYDSLSQASKDSLILQGGIYDNDEQIKSFENKSFYREAIQLRQFDDLGKNPEDQLDDFDHYFPLLESLHIIKNI